MERPKEGIPSDDPIRMLTSMYIKGEISEEEFWKKMDVLKEFWLQPSGSFGCREVQAIRS